MSSTRQLLDPLGTICKLVALNFSELQTRISIHNNVLKLQRPNNSQPIIRWWHRDGRENISDLYYVIVRVIKWYLIEDNRDINNKNTNEKQDNNIKIDNIDNATQIAKSIELRKMIKYLCDAFRKLQETYEFGNVVLSLQFYINLLESGLKGEFSEKLLPQCIIYKDTQYENLLDYNKLKNLWDIKRLSRICELYDSCFKVFNDNEIEINTKVILIEGYLKSINIILSITDNEFQKLIQNSSKD